MLTQVLTEIQQANGPITINELSRRLGIESSALQGMIDFWVRKGRLRDDDAAVAEEGACGGGSCGDNCFGLSACPFTAKMPRSYSIPLSKVE
jgi:DNA-binding Lrp family transcriptional regulator